MFPCSMRRRILFFIFLGLIVHTSPARDTLILEDDPGRYHLENHFSYLVDPSGDLTIDDVSGSYYKDKFIPSPGIARNFGYTDATYWLRFRVSNRSERFTSWILQAEFIWHSLLELYIPDGSGGYIVERTGHKLSLQDQDIKHSKLLFDFPVDRGGEATFYLKIHSGEAMILDFTILSYDKFIAEDHENQLLYGLFYGVLIIMMLYNLVYFFFSREVVFIYYAAWVLFLMLHQLQANGLYYEYLAPFMRSWLSFDPYYIIRGCSAIFSILLIRSLLDTSRYTPLLHRITYVFLGVSSLFLFIEFVIPAWIVDRMLVYYDFIMSALGIFLGTAVHIRGNRIAKFFIIGFGVPIIGTVVSSLSAGGIIPFNPFLLNMDQLGNIFTIIFFSVILGYRYRLLRQEKELAEHLNEEQTAFFINLSHEIKTPLTLINGYFQEYIREHGRNPALDVVERYITKLSRDMINFFDVLKFRKGKLVYKHDTIIDLSEYLGQAAELFRSPAARHGITIGLDIEPELYVRSDPYAFERIVNNLLDNAIKYNREGGEVHLSLSSTDRTVLLSVVNTGPGIEQEHLATVFEPYFQLSRAHRTVEGIGMGLAIVKQTVDTLGGKISVHNNPDEGCTFTVTLRRHFPHKKETPLLEQAGTGANGFMPAAVSSPGQPKEPEDAHETASRKGRTLLIVEDNRDLLALMHRRLAPLYNVFSAESYDRALHLVEEAKKNLPDLIISDIMLGDRDGRDLLKEIRKDSRLRRIPFMFITARTGREEKIDGLALGAVDYIYKPFVMEELLAKIESLFRLIDAEDKIKSQEKFASLGALLGAISHEIFNPLSGIRGPLANIHKIVNTSDLSEDSKLHKHLAFIEDNVNSIEDIIKSLSLLFAERDLEYNDVDLPILINEVVSGELASAGKTVMVEQQIPGGSFIRTNRNSAFHIIRNLFSNALDAVDENGKISMAYRAGESDREGVITITDNGKGMDKDVASRMFDPFFTTKQGLRGRGLGLYLVHHLSERLGWTIEVDSTPGEGTRVSILLPPPDGTGTN